MKKFLTISGEILSVAGFTAIFAVAESFKVQFIWTSAAVAALLLGQYLLKKAGVI